ncbi:MAG TPA: hypothetical protein VFA14_06490, partial [Herbaspirillum sp.]|nr:hypothetical protein [Herbaspirillum sp.]
QFWHGKKSPYPHDLRDEESLDAFLTSRIHITINSFPDPVADSLVMNCLPGVIPARLVPSLRHFVSSSIGKICPAVIASIAQNLKTSGVLGLTFTIGGVSDWVTASTGNSAQIFNSKGTTA